MVKGPVGELGEGGFEEKALLGNFKKWRLPKKITQFNV
jgi:hypothetical protein